VKRKKERERESAERVLGAALSSSSLKSLLLPSDVSYVDLISQRR